MEKLAQGFVLLACVALGLLSLCVVYLSVSPVSCIDLDGAGKANLMQRTAESLTERHDESLQTEPEVKLEGSEGISSMVRNMLRNADRDDKRAEFDQLIALSSLLPKITNISRIKTPSPEVFRNYIAPVGLPIIFTDLFDDAPLRQWSWDYIREKWGDHICHNARQGDFYSNMTNTGKYLVKRVSIKLSDFIDIVTGKREPKEAEKDLYVTRQKIIPAEALEMEFYYPPFYPGPHRRCYQYPMAWIGVQGTFSQGHFDSRDNFVYQIIGTKRWTLFSPTDYDYLYYVQNTGALEWSTALNSLNEPDLEKFPLFAKATPITFTMREGEMLYLPRGWTHFVENLTPALMINTWRIGPAAITEYWSEKNTAEIRKKCFLQHEVA